MGIAEEIDILIRARYPLLCILSFEEGRVQATVDEIAARHGKKVFEWSCTTGILPTGTSIQSQRARQSPTRDPLLALDQVVDQVEPAIFIFKDIHPYLNRQHPAVVRRLKEIAQQLKNSLKTIVLICPSLEIAPELEKDLTVLSFPLPTVSDLEALLDRIIEEVRSLQVVEVDLEGGGRERLLRAALGLTLGEAENVLAKMVVRSQRLSGNDVKEVLNEKQQIIRKNGLLEYYQSDATFSEVGGLALLKDWLFKRGLAFSEEARRFGLPAPRGLLLLGVQGCGKSLCAKAVSALWQLPLLRFDMGRMFGSLVGSSEENVRRAIAVAESISPAILWIDELDKAFAGAMGVGVADGGTTSRVLGTLLTWLSEKTAPVFVIATANEVSHLPPELLRKGRFDEIFFADLPVAEERREIAAIHLARRGRDPSTFDTVMLASLMDEFSGAEIEQSIIDALFDAFAQGRDLTDEDLQASARRSVPLAKTMEEQVSRFRKWAEGRARPASGISLSARS